MTRHQQHHRKHREHHTHHTHHTHHRCRNNERHTLVLPLSWNPVIRESDILESEPYGKIFQLGTGGSFNIGIPPGATMIKSILLIAAGGTEYNTWTKPIPVNQGQVITGQVGSGGYPGVAGYNGMNGGNTSVQVSPNQVFTVLGGRGGNTQEGAPNYYPAGNGGFSSTCCDYGTIVTTGTPGNDGFIQIIFA